MLKYIYSGTIWIEPTPSNIRGETVSQPVIELPTVPTELLDVLLDPEQTLLTTDRERWMRLDRHLFRDADLYDLIYAKRDGYSYRYTAQTCTGVARVIEALRKLHGSDLMTAAVELTTRVSRNAQERMVMAMHLKYTPQTCRCGLTAGNQQFSGWGVRRLDGIALVVKPTELGLTVTLALRLKTPTALQVSLHKSVEDFLCIDINPLGRMDVYAEYGRYVPHSYLRKSLGMPAQTVQTVTTGILQKDDPRLEVGEIDEFYANSLPVIADYLERLTYHDAFCHNHPDKKEH